ncbi:alpha/beta fold hydrolase [Nocardia sp. NPDC057668]|uniref:alpha/beta fold hydrolase n=1 Tax=Nocardia sp. NPDC057668 TaxID=3346202 RepID=UPI00366E285B
MITTTEPVLAADMTVSLDGFVCGLEARKPPYLDDGFFRVTGWVVKHFVWQEQHGLSSDAAATAVTDPEAELIAERIERTGAYVLGRRMFDSAGDEWDVESPYHVPTFVVTHRPRESRILADGTIFHFEADGVAAAVERARAVCRAAGEGKAVHISGGASIVQQALAAGLVDELHIHVVPVLLGRGTRLFDNLPAGIVELERYRVVDSADATHLSFRIPRTTPDRPGGTAATTADDPAGTTARTSTVTSRDGSTIAVDVIGSGAPVILIGGAFNDRSTVAALAAALAPDFTAVTYDRRARGGSDDRAADYATQSEIEDLTAVIAHMGGRASVFGHSSGGILALEGLMHGLPIDRVAVYETPYLTDGTRPAPAAGTRERLAELVRAGENDAAVTLFLEQNVGVPAEMVAGMRAADDWAFLVANAGGLPYDALVCGDDLAPPAARLAGIAAPVLAVYGDRTWPWLAAGTRAVGATVPGAETLGIAGADHGILADPERLAPVLRTFFAR